ncbi:MAG: ZIP family metal transporter [Candidatus Wildermuthbacteria bacterium]|nr:ZIP family metal transporter [Candidatus Wildermuthbacteria bacterium]
MPILAYILIFTFIGSIGSLIGGIILLSKEKLALRLSSFLTSFAAGVLLGTAFFDLLPEALEENEGNGTNIFFWALMGLLLFFLLEHTIHWFHHHTKAQTEHEKEGASTLPLIIAGDTVHNFIDGIVIGATFLASIPLGIATTFAVAAHEIPQEIGDFGIMLHKGLSRTMALLVNIASAAAALIGALLAYSFWNFFEGYIAAALAMTAGFFIYISTSDIIPEIHEGENRKLALVKSSLLVLGVIVVYVSFSLIKE